MYFGGSMSQGFGTILYQKEGNRMIATMDAVEATRLVRPDILDLLTNEKSEMVTQQKLIDFYKARGSDRTKETLISMLTTCLRVNW